MLEHLLSIKHFEHVPTQTNMYTFKFSLCPVTTDYLKSIINL